MILRSASLFLLAFWSTQAFSWSSPAHTTPSNGSSTWISTTVDWAAVAASEAYQLQVDTSVNFNSPLLLSVTQAYISSSNGNSDTRHELNDLRFGTSYRWRVRAYVNGDTSAWSTPWTFTTRDFVNLTTPSDGSSTWTAVTMDWAPHSGVSFYDAQLDTTVNFNSPVLREVSHVYGNSSDGNYDTRWDQQDLYFGKTYHWRVRARSAVDTSSWGTVRTFDTRDFVNLTTPANGSSTWTALTLDWAPHTGVSFYDAQLDTSASFNSPVLREVSHVYGNSSDGNYDTRWDQQDLYFGKTYHWRVRVRNMVDTSGWGTGRSFDTRDYVTLSSPANMALNQNVGGITLNWAPHNGITTYQLQWDTTYQFNSALLQAVSKPYGNSSDGNSDTQHPSGPLLADQWYFWQVRAVNAVDTSAWTMRRFSTGSTLPGVPAIPQQLAPANGSTVSSATLMLEWSAASGAQSYAYRFSTETDLANTTAVNSSALQAEVGPLTVGNTYYWSVQGINGVDTSAWSPIWSFTYDPSTGLRESTGPALLIFPNPARNTVNITLTQGNAERLMLYDASGRILRDEGVTGQSVEFEMTSLPQGSYVLQLHSSEGIITRSIVRAD
ncbi:MAG: T9SS type A sorting domain-containing protein [Flavobacteriales bacterium]|nr:T9SS type A sorting domain-containing protein [Flavobacteriales bacterium]